MSLGILSAERDLWALDAGSQRCRVAYAYPEKKQGLKDVEFLISTFRNEWYFVGGGEGQGRARNVMHRFKYTNL